MQNNGLSIKIPTSLVVVFTKKRIQNSKTVIDTLFSRSL